jgi:hypothetical protein
MNFQSIVIMNRTPALEGKQGKIDSLPKTYFSCLGKLLKMCELHDYYLHK